MNNIVTTGTDRGKKSGFCKHSPAIREFALSSPKNMYVVFAFVFFTMGKGWHNVNEYFPSFMEWLLKRGKREGFTYSSKEKFAHLNSYVKTSSLSFLTKNINNIYSFIKENKDNELTVFQYLVEKVDGLGPAKAAFIIQLILGKYGCIDSVNTLIYKNELPDGLTNSVGVIKSAKFDKHGKLQKGSIELLKKYTLALDVIAGDKHCQILWDDWCEIIEKKLLFSAKKSELDKNMVEIKLTNGQSKFITPYGIKGDAKELQKVKEIIKNNPNGQTVSSQHRDLITRFGENLLYKLYDNILIENIDMFAMILNEESSIDNISTEEIVFGIINYDAVSIKKGTVADTHYKLFRGALRAFSKSFRYVPKTHKVYWWDYSDISKDDEFLAENTLFKNGYKPPFVHSDIQAEYKMLHGIKESIRSAIAGGILGASSLFANPTPSEAGTPSAITHVVSSNQTNLNILARTIYAEAKNEGISGMKAVASVIHNRGNGNITKMVKEVKQPKQFSCWNKMNWSTFKIKERNDRNWYIAKQIANDMISGKFKPTTIANHYYNPKLCSPAWAYKDESKKVLRPYTELGNHRFMKI